MGRIKPTAGGIYHIYNRGVEKRNVFLDTSDRLRFIHDLFEFNSEEPAPNLTYHIGYKQAKEVGLPKLSKRRKLIIELLAFCLMPNHFHLMVKQRVDNGVSFFMQKLGTGYTNYFNQKYERVGSLFQGKYKLVAIKNETHFLHLPYYIHANPLDLVTPKWRSGEIRNYGNALKSLENYRWSSFLDYVGKQNFPSVTQRDLLLKFSGSPTRYRNDFTRWLREMVLEEIQLLTLE